MNETFIINHACVPLESAEASAFEAKLRKLFDGYHIEIEITPVGGLLVLHGCEECGTESGVIIDGWDSHRKNETISTAISRMVMRV